MLKCAELCSKSVVFNCVQSGNVRVMEMDVEMMLNYAMKVVLVLFELCNQAAE